MATEVLHSRDLLSERFSVAPTPFHRRRNLTASRNATSLASNRRQHRKVSPKHDNGSRFSGDAAAAKKSSHGGDNGLVMGQVTLLRRGESLSLLTVKEPVQNPAYLEKIPPPAEIVLKQIRVVAPSPAAGYAGSGCFTSPSPRSVPLPSFFSKKEPENSDLFEDGATRDLRRLLRLE
ncbi:hypothetical protein ACP275_14G012800 [Erythranthe tilingii]